MVNFISVKLLQIIFNHYSFCYELKLFTDEEGYNPYKYNSLSQLAKNA